jgi:hypothetical protein
MCNEGMDFRERPDNPEKPLKIGTCPRSRAAIEKAIKGEGWIGPNPDGVSTLTINDHHGAKAVTGEVMPSAAKVVLKAGEDCFFTSGMRDANGKSFTVFSASFIVPGGDDPDRIESGWGMVITRGPLVYFEKYLALIEDATTAQVDDPRP